MMIEVGKQIPDVEADAYHNGEIKRMRLSSARGKWVVLIFYPADFTFVCPTELEEAANLYAEFRKEGAEVMSVSTDTAYVHKAWHDTSPSIKKIQFPMLADPSGDLSRRFGTYIAGSGLSLRGTFIIDPEGILRAFEINDNSIGRSAHETLRKLQAAKFVRENKGLVCPASWKPGQKPLGTGIELVGKI